MGSEDHFRSMLHDIMTAEKFTDITIVCDDMRPISCHRNILSACSPVLNDMLQVNADSQNPVLYLKGIDYEEMQSIMRFIYLGQVTFNHGRIQQFLSVAQSLKLKDFNDLNDLLVPSNKDLSLKETGQKSDNTLSKIEERIEGEQFKSCSVTSKDEIVHGLMDLEESLFVEDHDVSHALSEQKQKSGTIDDTILPMDEMIINFEEPLTMQESLDIDERKKNTNEQGDFYYEMKHSEQKNLSLKYQHVKNYDSMTTSQKRKARRREKFSGSSPIWLKDLLEHFTERVIDPLSKRAQEALKNNENIQSIHEKKNIRREIKHKIIEVLIETCGRPSVFWVRKVAERLGQVYPAMFQDDEGSGYGLGGKMGTDGLADHILADIRKRTGKIN